MRRLGLAPPAITAAATGEAPKAPAVTTDAAPPQKKARKRPPQKKVQKPPPVVPSPAPPPPPGPPAVQPPPLVRPQEPEPVSPVATAGSAPNLFGQLPESVDDETFLQFTCVAPEIPSQENASQEEHVLDMEDEGFVDPTPRRAVRGANFTTKEDKLLCEAWKKIGLDPITGVEQQSVRGEEGGGRGEEGRD